MHEHMELNLSQRGWENDPPHRPSVMSFWIESGLSLMRPDCGFTLFKVTPNRRGTMRPAARRHACHFASSRGESEMESQTMNSRLCERTCDQSTSLEPFSVFVLLPLLRCPQAKHQVR